MITVFDPLQRLHAPGTFLVAGRPRPSPETPERADLLLAGAVAAGCRIVAPPPITLADAATVHDPRYLTFLDTVLTRWQQLPDASEVPLANVYALGRASLPPTGYPESIIGQAGFHLGDAACPLLPETLTAALASAATALYGARLLLGGEPAVYALCRPPGHHAASDHAAGFCYFNNSALAAEALLRAGKRPAILDIDVHHGNGTEAIFYDRADVLTVSLHADPANFYPFFWGYAGERGRGAGEGFNLNVPLPRGTQLPAFRAALDTALTRITEFGADVLVLALGLDIAIDDPFRGFAIATPEFATIGRAIADLGLPTLLVQEGGYPSPSLSHNLTALIHGFCG